jgi:SAM-dependent methyltransferase
MLKGIIKFFLKVGGVNSYKFLDKIYVPLDRAHIRRTKNIRLIPTEDNRKPGKYSYAEWAHVIGIFQTLMFIHLDKREENRVVDVGCGTGLVGIASEPFLGENGWCIGIDIMKSDIDFCQNHYPSPPFEFIHLNANNPFYAPSQSGKKLRWPLDSSSIDLVTALSVWTHLNEEDALFYIAEVNRILKPGGKAIITLFLLDELYKGGLGLRSKKPGRYHMTSQDEWIFDQPAYGSDAWFYPKWAQIPENAIGITDVGLNRLITAGGLELIEHYQGNWKEKPGIFFQDVLIFKKREEGVLDFSL